ncbi:uncharacterized protein LOC132205240 [Neocloeon triangulifer]|uniref:uncharacterized protein LOC132205240 n=1 Tax=Neocloeon triangulifer TaxID=2078957 RepID=UPI00286F9570|nr:uncharacterized protein LOC132205240 [Neocloeon triangulifer]
MLSSENIYNLVAPLPRAKSPVRLFVNNERVERFKERTKKLQSEHRTMGVPEVSLPKPVDFLKKQDRDHRPKLVTLEKSDHARVCETLGLERRPPVPDHFFQDPRRSPRDFCSENVEFARNLIPPVPKERIVVGARGAVVDLDTTVLRPKYLDKPNFGQLPVSVVKFQAKANREAKLAQELKELEEQQKTQQLLDNKNHLRNRLAAAKEEWDEKNKEFLLLPVITDTLMTKKKKYLLEKALAELEDEINCLHYECQLADKAWQIHLEQNPPADVSK